MSSVVLQNTLNVAVTVFAADGEDVSLPANSQHSVDAKFTWNPPRGVRVVKSKVEVKTPTASANVAAVTSKGIQVR